MELLEPAAMLEGLVEQHPDVVSIVLNQASEPANSAFNVALKCLRLLFQGVGKLGCRREGLHCLCRSLQRTDAPRALI
jgi:hypothetical protein